MKTKPLNSILSIFIKIFFILFLISFTSQEKNTYLTHLGVNNIEVVTSTLKDVKNEFGKKSIKKERGFKEGFQLIGKKMYFIDYKDKGLKFSTFLSGKKQIVEKIIISSNCKFKTKGGIGIGSTYEELKKELGQPFFFNNSNKDNPLIFFDNGKKTTLIGYKHMFITLNSMDTLNAKISDIIFSFSNQSK
jgi:hypothetical protein